MDTTVIKRSIIERISIFCLRGTYIVFKLINRIILNSSVRYSCRQWIV